MKKTTTKMNLYGFAYFFRTLFFNIALGFAIASVVKYKDGLTWMAITAIAFTAVWLLVWDSVHYLWFSMDKLERTLYLAIRRFGTKIPEISREEINSKTGQKESKGFFDDADGALEVKMAVNGAATFINLFVGAHWLMNAKKFNKNPQVFAYTVVDKNKNK